MEISEAECENRVQKASGLAVTGYLIVWSAFQAYLIYILYIHYKNSDLGLDKGGTIDVEPYRAS